MRNALHKWCLFAQWRTSRKCYWLTVNEITVHNMRVMWRVYVQTRANTSQMKSPYPKQCQLSHANCWYLLWNWIDQTTEMHQTTRKHQGMENALLFLITTTIHIQWLQTWELRPILNIVTILPRLSWLILKDLPRMTIAAVIHGIVYLSIRDIWSDHIKEGDKLGHQNVDVSFSCILLFKRMQYNWSYVHVCVCFSDSGNSQQQ